MITDKKALNIYEKYVFLWGENAQFMMVIEELSELAVVLCHALGANKPFEMERIKEEMVDVQIMLEQLQYMLKFTDEELIEQREKKLDRLEDLIKFDEEHR